ncbi:DUF3460 family protein [Candidatus Kinetoplastidibacterium crithidiae]|uniref:DUF3460 family protein n=1 Tax=Candidatus Kinetoplastidibacterium crithidiae TCC036E TaxID=1208918 RepID=M1LXH3_9PROT|nr:DUF3460 family protein [Candidatus Kinetoplastibacterium crithidii]AGF47909.1 protein of unknown function of the DUF3460 family [Candidatus Kinetoplastibacterium crithidii TCC036E]
MSNQYESEITIFLRNFKQSNPDIALKQYAGRAILWDKVIDKKLKKDFDYARVPQKPYVYQVD